VNAKLREAARSTPSHLVSFMSDIAIMRGDRKVLVNETGQLSEEYVVTHYENYNE
jgi:hypothetical protein